MQVAFDVSCADTSEPTGVQRALGNLLSSLDSRNRTHRFVLVAPAALPPLPPLGPAFEAVALRAPGGRFLWRERVLPELVRERGIDLIHSPVAAFSLTAACRTVATVHEIPWLEAGTAGDEGRRARHRIWARLAASRSDRVLCVSRTTADRFGRLYPEATPRVRVVPHGVDPRFRPGTGGGDDEVLRRLGVPPDPFVVAVGRARGKKNLSAAVASLRALLERRELPHRLVFVGPAGPALGAALERARECGLGGRVQALGHVADDDLVALLRRAAALLHLSFSEGFGFPPLEAMACGTPVVASDRGAIPEVAGDAALLVPPDDPAAAGEAIRRIVEEPSLRATLVSRGVARAAAFRWDAAAESVLAVYDELGGG